MILFVCIHTLISAAQAGVIGNCYSAAETAYPTMELKGWLNGSLDKTFTKIGPAMQWIAANHTDATVDFTGNSAGISAVKAAMNCVWNNDRITLSSIFVNQTFASFQVNSTTLVLREEEGGTAITSYTFAEVRAACNGTGYDMVLAFTDDASSREDINIGVNEFGTDDYAWAVSGGEDDTTWECVPNVNDPCNASCGSPSGTIPPGGTPSCTCSGTGYCHATGSAKKYNMSDSAATVQTW